MKKILTGLQPTGVLTLGNYIGTISQLLDYQKKGNKIFLSVVNLHSITLPFNPKELKKNTIILVKLFLACGLDQENTIIFVQSDIPEHTYLSHLLLCNSTIDELRKMTQFKDKGEKGFRKPNGSYYTPTGLLTYPVLQAADILLYNPDLVPIGEDQSQHLELCRNLAIRLNNKFKTNFTIPQAILKTEGTRIKSLTNPDNKMSKSDPNKKSTIFLLDDIEVIKKKIFSAKTDSENKVYYDPETKPGVANLLEIYAALKNIKIKHAVSQLESLNYKDFKEKVYDTIRNILEPIQIKYKEISDKTVFSLLHKNNVELKKIANNNLKEIKDKLGLNYEK